MKRITGHIIVGFLSFIYSGCIPETKLDYPVPETEFAGADAQIEPVMIREEPDPPAGGIPNIEEAPQRPTRLHTQSLDWVGASQTQSDAQDQIPRLKSSFQWNKGAVR